MLPFSGFSSQSVSYFFSHLFPIVFNFFLSVAKMLRLLFRNNPIHDLPIKLGSNPITHLRFITKSSISKIPKQPINDQNHPSSSLTVSYLINSCGLSPHSALSLSKKFTINTTQNPDSVLNLLKSYGFADAQIAKIIAVFPYLLAYDTNNNIRPKLEFYLRVGYSSTQLTDLITSSPNFLKGSLEKRIIPNFDLLRSVFDTNQQLVAVRRTSWLLGVNLDTNFLPNVRVLQHYGVPVPNIAKIATLNPRGVLQTTEQFKMKVESIVKMGFDPSSPMFVHGMHARLGLSDCVWKRKVAVYKSVGWSEEEVVSAFTKLPYFMLSSEEKIKKAMGVFVKEMRWSPSFVAADPMLLKLSLEKRVIPRCWVMNVLLSKGLVKTRSAWFLKIKESDFINKYVIKYQDKAPGVLQAYRGNLGESASIQGS